AREVAQAQIREALGEVQRLEGLLEERSRALETAWEELARERERNRVLEEQLEAVRGEAARTLAEQRGESARILAQERADAQRDREVLEGRLAALEGQLARELERFDAQQRYWTDQVDAARRDTDQLRQAADNQIRLLTEELKQARERQGKLERRLAALDAEGQRLSSDNRALAEERDGLRERVERLSATLERRAGVLMVLREHWRSTARTVQVIGADPQLAEAERVARLAQVLALPGMLDEAAGDETR
ncbi:MAG: hypothetical protein R3310_09860, partial [Candidatus Competibacteraceae bacterium]|nr:hypothetical protein [Candidatus Competibacteraceae bacterium]